MPTALVTGASTGIGAAYAERLAARGHDLIVVARDEVRLTALAAQLRAGAGVAVEVLRADLTRDDELHAVESRVRNDGAIALLVNNAGASVPTPVVGTDPDWIEAVVRLNVLAFTRLASAAANAFAARGSGTLVNLSSSVALTPGRYGPVYGATKAYILYYTQALAAELAGSGVHVQAVLPGAVRTEIWERSGKDISLLDPARVMEPSELVDAALAGLDLGEIVTIPSLPDAGEWEALHAMHLALEPRLSRDRAADRYRATDSAR
jgi:short-subunit dehydrogenase